MQGPKLLFGEYTYECIDVLEIYNDAAQHKDHMVHHCNIRDKHQNARLFVMYGTEDSSQEGGTQGCPAAMPVYALATVSLLESVSSHDTDKLPMQMIWFCEIHKIQ